MVDVNKDEHQGDAHVIRTPEGSFFLIDTGDERPLLQQYLSRLGVKKFEKAIISHWHMDHYGSLQSLIEHGVSFNQVVANPPVRSVCDYEKGWGCNFDHLQSVFTFLRSKQIPVVTTKANDVLYDDGKGTRLEVIYTHDGISPPVGKTDVNGTTILVKLTHPKVSVLFTGDLNDKTGEFLGRSDLNLKSEILKLPHHGTETAAPNIFYDKVAAKVAFVPSPRGLWSSPRSKRMKDYFESKKIPVYVNGIDGTVCLHADGNAKTKYAIRRY